MTEFVVRVANDLANNSEIQFGGQKGICDWNVFVIPERSIAEKQNRSIWTGHTSIYKILSNMLYVRSTVMKEARDLANTKLLLPITIPIVIAFNAIQTRLQGKRHASRRRHECIEKILRFSKIPAALVKFLEEIFGFLKLRIYNSKRSSHFTS